jgi:cysteine desulfurase/selenocysteine lyase
MSTRDSFPDQSSPPTPGLALAAAKVPGAPTLPEWDPSSLTVLVQRLANDAFAAPPASPLPALPALSALVTPLAPGAMAEARPALPMAVTLPSPGAPAGAPHVSDTISPGSSVLSPGAPAGAPHVSDTISPGSSVVSPGAPAGAPHVSDTISGPFSVPLDLGGRGVLGPVGSMPLLEVPASVRVEEVSGGPVPRFGDSFEVEPVQALEVGGSRGSFDAQLVRREFPILDQEVNGRRLVWLDNAATTQKPRVVIDRLKTYYERENSNVHRAAHTLAARATDAYESARDTARRFIGASGKDEIVFVRGATEGINLIARSWGARHLGPGDEILITWLEHHANIVPWQMLAADKGATLKVAPVDDDGQIIMAAYEKLLGPKTRLVSLTQVSNALGTITPARQMVELAHRHGATVVVDGAQAVSHMPVDVQALDCDFYVFSGHKVFAPTGIGVVYGKRRILADTPPWQGGGNMIQDVTFERTVYQPPPSRFEAGTGNIAAAVGLGAALDWLMRLGLERVQAYEHQLLAYATAELARVPGLRLIGTAPDKAGVLSFVLAGQKTEEVGGLLDREGIAVRSGHHCAQPILRRFGLEATVRASLAPYNTVEDLDSLVAALARLQVGKG